MCHPRVTHVSPTRRSNVDKCWGLIEVRRDENPNKRREGDATFARRVGFSHVVLSPRCQGRNSHHSDAGQRAAGHHVLVCDLHLRARARSEQEQNVRKQLLGHLFRIKTTNMAHDPQHHRARKPGARLPLYICTAARRMRCGNKNTHVRGLQGASRWGSASQSAQSAQSGHSPS